MEAADVQGYIWMGSGQRWVRQRWGPSQLSWLQAFGGRGRAPEGSFPWPGRFTWPRRAQDGSVGPRTAQHREGLSAPCQQLCLWLLGLCPSQPIRVLRSSRGVTGPEWANQKALRRSAGSDQGRHQWRLTWAGSHSVLQTRVEIKGEAGTRDPSAPGKVPLGCRTPKLKTLHHRLPRNMRPLSQPNLQEACPEKLRPGMASSLWAVFCHLVLRAVSTTAPLGLCPFDRWTQVPPQSVLKAAAGTQGQQKGHCTWMTPRVPMQKGTQGTHQVCGGTCKRRAGAQAGLTDTPTLPSTAGSGGLSTGD